MEGIPLPQSDYTYITKNNYDYLVANPVNNRYGYQFLQNGTNAASTLLNAADALDPNNGDRLLGLYGARGQNGNLPINSANGQYQNTGLDNFSLYSSAQAGAPNNITPGIPNPDTVRPLLPGETDANSLVKYNWGNHSNRPVPVYFQGNGSDVLNGFVGQGYNAYGQAIPGIAGLVDQSHIARTQLDALQMVPEPSAMGGLAVFGLLAYRLKQRKG